MIAPLTDRCGQICALGEYAIIGISAFNSYFSESTLQKIIHFTQCHFSDFDLYLPDKPNEFTLLALGYAPNKASRKARRQANYMRNKITTSLALFGYSETDAKKKIIDHEVLENNDAYSYAYNAIRNHFISDPTFKNRIIRASAKALKRKSTQLKQHITITNEDVCVSAEYLLAELPIMTSTNKILQKLSSVFCYHECPDYLKYLYATQRGNLVSYDHAFLTLPKFTKEKVGAAGEF